MIKSTIITIVMFSILFNVISLSYGWEGSKNKEILVAQASTCSKLWLWNWCNDKCEEAQDCREGVIDYWLERRSECENNPVRAKEAIERACKECNRVCQSTER